VTRSRSVASLVIALSIAATVVSGCTGPAAKPGPVSAPRVEATATPSTISTTATETSAPAAAKPGNGSGLSAADLERMRKQLEAMQREINSLRMPTDDDFNSAAGDLY